MKIKVHITDLDTISLVLFEDNTTLMVSEKDVSLWQNGKCVNQWRTRNEDPVSPYWDSYINKTELEPIVFEHSENDDDPMHILAAMIYFGSRCGVGLTSDDVSEMPV